LKNEIARFLELAAHNDYKIGFWVHYLDTMKILSRIYPHHASDSNAEIDFSDNGFLSEVLFSVAMLVIITERLFPSVKDFAESKAIEILESLGMYSDDDWHSIIPPHVKNLEKVLEEDLWHDLEKQLYGCPWSDTTKVIKNTWASHGIAWEVEWGNSYATNLAVEEFLAMLQIFLSDLGNTDLVLLKTKINLTIILNSSVSFDKFDVRFLPSNKDSKAIVTLPYLSKMSMEEILIGILGVITTLLLHLSLLPEKEIYKKLEDKFQSRLAQKVAAWDSYSRCVGQFISDKEKSNLRKA
jgi:hypothetical protein